MTQEKSFIKGRSSDILKRTLDEGLLTSEGLNHQRQKKYILPAFHRQRIVSYADIITEETSRMLESWKGMTSISVSDEMMELTLRIIIRVMFGRKLGNEQVTAIRDGVETAILYSAKRLYSPIPIPLGLPTPWNLRLKRAIATIDDILYPLIRNADEQELSEREDFLGLLLATRTEDGSKLSIQEIRNQLVTMLIAGHETSANTLAWACFLLAQYPESEQKLRTESNQVLGERADVRPFELAQKLPYTQQVIQETLRLYPAAWTILREAAEPVTIHGSRFVKGSIMMISPYAIQRNPLFFPEPLRFKPDRFAGDAMQKLPRFAYFPFGGGSRSCIGSSFAMLEMTLILAHLFHRFSIRLLGDAREVQADLLISLRIRDGLTVSISPIGV